MPELPEVETIKRGLAGQLRGRRIHDVTVYESKSVPMSTQQCASFVSGATIKQLWRRGKVLGLDLNTDHTLLVHLKMTGQLLLERPHGERSGGGHPTPSLANQLPDRSTRAVFGLDDGSRLFFNDQRKFGWIKLYPSASAQQEELLARLGPEPSDVNFTPKTLRDSLVNRRAPIKALLLDQSVVAGLGNIYVDESLHQAQVHPLRPGNTLGMKEVERLYAAIVDIIDLAVALEGTTFRDYLNHNGQSGGYFAQARVFNRTGQPCPTCQTAIEKIKVAGRGTHICPQCQELTP